MEEIKKCHINEAIKKYAKISKARFHMPGHKGSIKGLKKFAKLDTTELEVIQNQEVLRLAEKDIANIYGSQYCRIISGGATQAILAMVCAVKHLGDKLIISRFSHKSIFNACKLFNIEPVILSSIIIGEKSYHPTLEEIDNAIKNNPNSIGVFLNGTDYYGNTLNAKQVRQIVEKYNKLLILDNAHGAHLKFTGDTYAGDYADMWADSAHKTLSSFNQGAMVFCNNSKLINELENSLDILLTTSPSYPILGSVEYGVKNYAYFGKKALNRAIKLTSRFIQKIKKLGIECSISGDKLRFCIETSQSQLDAKQVEQILAKKGIFPEMNDGYRLLFMVSSKNTKRDFYRLYKGLKCVAKSKNIGKNQKAIIVSNKKINYLEATKSEYILVDIKNSVGKISASSVGLFPPCFPLVVAGEEITEEIAQILLESTNVFGLEQGKIKIIKE